MAMKRLFFIFTVFLFANLSYASEIDYYNSYLIRGDKESFISMPEGSFCNEVQNIFKNQHDPISDNLHSESLGWQAYAEYKKGDFISSMKHYLALNDDLSLSIVCKEALNAGDDTIREILNDNILKKVLIAWAFSRREDFWGNNIGITEDHYEETRNSLMNLFYSIETIDDFQFTDIADRLAWAFFNKGDFQTAQKWIDMADPESKIAIWVQAKLLINNDDTSGAIEKLKELALKYENNTNDGNYFFFIDRNEAKHKIYAQITFLLMSEGDYEQAFEYSIKSRYWKDIAYIAEKVLTLGELESYLDHCETDDPIYNKIKYLAARRFARDGQWQKAIQYIPDSTENSAWEDTGCKQILVSLKLKMEEYYQCLLNAQNIELANTERAKNYYAAGSIMRENGMEMTGTELEPDWLLYEGSYYNDSSIEHRFSIVDETLVEEQRYAWGTEDDYIIERVNEVRKKRAELETSSDFFTGCLDEEKRALESLPRINKRFHYRYEAAELMWKCSELLPNNDLLKAKALCTAGTYLKIRDPKSAEKYYKELIKTCSETKIGKAAKEIKWFPKPEAA